MKKFIVILIALGFVLMVGSVGFAGQPTAYKINPGDPRWNTKLNAGLDALWDSDTALNTLITGWAIEDQIVTMIPVTCTFSDNNTFTIPGDYTSRFPASAVVQIQVAAGMVYSTVASSSYAAPTTTVNLNDTVLTSPIARVYVVATRDGLWPNGPGYIVARDYGVPGQAALTDALAAAGSLERTIILSPGTWSVTANTTIPANITLKPERGAILAIATGKTLTINGTLDAGLYQIFDCVGTGKVRFEEGVVKEVYPEWWKNNTIPGTTDMSPAIQAAIDSAAYPNAVSLTSGRYLLNTALDLTTKTVGGTIYRSATHLKGAAYTTSYLIGNTGNLMIDTSGSDFIFLENISLSSILGGPANPSVVGILQAKVTDSNSCQFHVYRNVFIDLHDDPTANGNKGTVAIANCQAESATYDTVFLRANRCFIATIDSTYLYGIDSVYHPGAIDPAIGSMGSIKFVGHNNLWTVNRRQPAIVLTNVVDFIFAGEIMNAGLGGDNDIAISFGAICSNITVNAVIEALGTVIKLDPTGPGYSILRAANFNVISANATDVTVPVIDASAADTYIHDSNLIFSLSGATGNLTRNLILNPGGPDNVFRNTLIKTNQLSAHAITALSQNFVNYCNQANLVIETADGRLDTNTKLWDWSTSSIPVPATAGFDGALSTRVCGYSVNGDEVTVRFNFVGTSNQTYFRFILPFVPCATIPYQVSFNCQVKDAGAWNTAPGMVSIEPGSTTANIYLGGSGTVFTNSGTKGANGEIKYYRIPQYPW